MGFDDRHYRFDDSEGGGRWGKFGARFGRLLDNPDNPLGWSVKMFRAFGIETRVHLVTVLFIAAYILSSIPRGNMGAAWTTLTMAVLFALVLIHEFGHCFAARWAGGEADRVVLLPFGGLALTRPPHTWQGHLMTTVGGPAVHVVILPLTALGLLLAGHAGAIVFNPFAPGPVVASLAAPGEPVKAWLLQTLWVTHFINIVLLGFNVLLPIFPLDGGRIVQALVWRKTGFRRSMEIAVHTGLAGAVALFIFAVVFGETLLVAIAIFGGIACWVERSRLRAADDITGYVPESYGMGGMGVSAQDMLAEAEKPVRGPGKRQRKQMERERKEQDEVDRILAKIAEQGMQSITPRERKLLDRVSKKKRTSV